MMRTSTIMLSAATLLAACNSNTSPGNDKLAELESEPVAALQMAAGPALENADPAELYPGIMNEADMASLGGTSGRCVFRMTKVAFPSFIYGGENTDAAVKLNGKLVMLSPSQGRTYRSGELAVTITQLDDGDAANLILDIPGAAHELGFTGFASCAR